MMNENSQVKNNPRIKSFVYKNRENIILVMFILCAVLSLIYKIYEINNNKLAVLNINDKNKIQITNDGASAAYPNAVQESNDADNSAAVSAPMFILSEKDGKLALYSGDGNEVREIYDVYIETLPEYDKRELAVGIAVYDLKDLESLIEAFTS